MSERERLEQRLQGMPTSELLHCLDKTRAIDDDITELLIRYIEAELAIRREYKAG